MKKFFAFLLLISAPLMAQHATQFAYYSTTSCEIIPFPGETSSSTADSPESAPPIPYSAIAWDPETQVSTEGFSLESNATVFTCRGEIAGPNTIHIHHAGWYFAKFLISAIDAGNYGGFRFGLLNVDDLTIIPFSVYGVQSREVEQFAGQVVFYAPANTRIQLVNDAPDETIINPDINNSIFLTSLYLFELLGR